MEEIIDGFVFEDSKRIIDVLDEKDVTNLIIPEGVEEIGEKAFLNHRWIETVTFPSTLKYIGKEAFGICTNLKKITFKGESLEEIMTEAFNYCRSLEEVIFPQGLEGIGFSAFANCENLKRVYIPSTVNIIVYDAFAGCNIDHITIDKNNKYYSDKGCNIIYSKKDDLIIKGNKNGIIPEGTKVIGALSFKNIDFDNAIITLPNTLKEINTSAFENAHLKNVIFNNNLERIGNSAFCNAKFDSTDLILPEKLRIIDDFAFSNIDSIQNIYIPPSVMLIGDNVFYHCTNLKTAYCFNKYKISASDFPFLGCDNLENIYINKKAIVAFDNEFINEHKSIIKEPVTLDTLLENGKSFKETNKVLKNNFKGFYYDR